MGAVIMFNINISHILLGFVGLVFVTACSASSDTVSTTVTNNKTYYHLKYSLTNENIISLNSLTMDQFVINGGQFELLLNKSEFPISAPNCKSDLILRMPWTNSEITNSDLFIQEKYEVYKNIKNLTDSGRINSMDIYIELNPYVEFTEEELILTQCNIFFRQSAGQYISKIGMLKK